jgi:DNA-binding transcriptional MerR regulator
MTIDPTETSQPAITRPKRVRRYRSVDRRHNRKKKKPPTEGYLIDELVRLSGVAGVTIKNYIRRGVLARVKFYGTATRYPRGHLLRLLVIRFLKLNGVRKLDDARRNLDAMTEAEMQRWLLKFPLAPAVVAALGLSPSSTHDTGAQATSTTSSLATTLPNEAWRKVVLMPGLELQLKIDAGPLTVNLANRLLSVFASFLDVKPNA